MTTRWDPAPPRTPRTPEIIAHFFDSLEMPAKTLTEWELGFLESAKDQFDRRGALTDRQFEILERIYTEKAP
jgi:hypothetical protein